MTDVSGTTHAELHDELAGQFDTTARVTLAARN